MAKFRFFGRHSSLEAGSRDVAWIILVFLALAYALLAGADFGEAQWAGAAYTHQIMGESEDKRVISVRAAATTFDTGCAC